ncbi:exocyst complex component 1 [Paragonimus westermani]|uniref:Exocyst complex component 1 n=1 Tax=Paragonimus westermani TaxID=34504 RepID=A0A5J4NII0_9TREM|nr:exocyst complex component 1 [Paragonimus westermani]
MDALDFLLFSSIPQTNIHSIMASEAQVLKLMTILDQAISQADKLEQQMSHYHQYLSDVEEAMTTLRDRDQLIQVTMDNRGRLLRVLEDLVSRLTLDARYVRSLIEVKLDSPSDIVQCTEAARYLDALLNASTTPGEEHLQAVDEQMNELKRLRDLFAAELAKKVNNTVINFSRQLKFVINLGSSLAPEQSGSDNASQEYVRQMQSYFRHQTSELFNRAQQAVAGLIKPSKSSHSSRILEASDTGSVISVHNPEASVLNQVATSYLFHAPIVVVFQLVSDLIERIRMTVSTEEQFFGQFFNMQLTEDTQTRETSIYAMQDEVTTLTGCMHALFRELESDGFAFVASCEHLQPILVMPLLVVMSRQMESETPLSDQVNLAEKDHAAFITYFLARLTMATKRSFNRYIERLIQSFKDSKPSKKSRCGVLRIVLNYVDFAECSIAVFSRSKRMVDLERAHGELVRALMAQLEQIAFQSVKTPREVVQLENYHRLNDILRRLKMSGLEEYLQETKIRYARALEEYTKNSMGRPLEKLATFFEGVQAALDAGVRPEVIQYQFAFSKQELRKVIREYPGREVVWRSIQAQFLEQCQLFNVLINECYPDSGIALEFTIDHLQNYFAEIAHSR